MTLSVTTVSVKCRNFEYHIFIFYAARHVKYPNISDEDKKVLQY